MNGDEHPFDPTRWRAGRPQPEQERALAGVPRDLQRVAFFGVLSVFLVLLGMLLHNAPGALLGISVVGTQQWVEIIREATVGDARKAKALHNRFGVPLMDGIYEYQLQKTPVSTCAANKEALVQLGEIPSSWVRPPALNITPARQAAIREALQRSGLLMAKAAVGM